MGFWGLQPSLIITALCESEICTQSKQPRRLTRAGSFIHRQTVCLYSHPPAHYHPRSPLLSQFVPPVIISFYLIQLAFPPTLGGNLVILRSFLWSEKSVLLL